jgi:hypothetical protein
LLTRHLLNKRCVKWTAPFLMDVRWLLMKHRNVLPVAPVAAAVVALVAAVAAAVVVAVLVAAVVVVLLAAAAVAVVAAVAVAIVTVVATVIAVAIAGKHCASHKTAPVIDLRNAKTPVLVSTFGGFSILLR